jgi:hypothetical protein
MSRLQACMCLVLVSMSRASKQALEQISARLCIQTHGCPHLHPADANVRSAVFICTAGCLLVPACVSVHSRLFICSRLCTYAQRRAHLQPAVYIRTAACLFARGCAYVHKGMLICIWDMSVCTAMCLFTRGRAHVHNDALVYTSICKHAELRVYLHVNMDACTLACRPASHCNQWIRSVSYRKRLQLKSNIRRARSQTAVLRLPCRRMEGTAS